MNSAAGPPREFPAYQRGPPQDLMDRIAEKRKLEEVRSIRHGRWGVGVGEGNS